MLRLCSPARFQSPYAIFVTTSPRSLMASRTAPMSKWRLSVLLTPISILSKSMNTAIFNLSSTIICRITLTSRGWRGTRGQWGQPPRSRGAAPLPPCPAPSAAVLFPRNLDHTYFVRTTGRDVDLVALLVRHKVSQHFAAGRDRPSLEAAVFGVESDDCVG